jgi:hypothetical protein
LTQITADTAFGNGDVREDGVGVLVGDLKAKDRPSSIRDESGKTLLSARLHRQRRRLEAGATSYHGLCAEPCPYLHL